MASASIDISDELFEIVKKELQKKLEAEWESTLSKFNARKSEIISGTLLQVMKYVYMQSGDGKMIFTVREMKDK